MIQLSKFKKGKTVNVKDFESLKIIEVGLNYCNSLIEEDKDITINNEVKLAKVGKEWIKLLSGPSWCDSDLNNKYVYIFPKYNKKSFITCASVKNAKKNIIFKDQILDLSYVNEKYDREDRKDFAKIKEENELLKDKIKSLK